MDRLDKLLGGRAFVMHGVFALVEGCKDELAIRVADELLSWLSTQQTTINGGPNFLRPIYKTNLVAMLNCSCRVSQPAYARRVVLSTCLGSRSVQTWASGGISDLPTVIGRLSETEEKRLIGSLISLINKNMSLALDENYVSDRSGERLAQTPDHWVVVGASHAKALAAEMTNLDCETSYIEYAGRQDLTKSRAVAIELEHKLNQLRRASKRNVIIV